MLRHPRPLTARRQEQSPRLVKLTLAEIQPAPELGQGEYFRLRAYELAGSELLSEAARRAWRTRRARGAQLALALCMGQPPLFPPDQGEVRRRTSRRRRERAAAEPVREEGGAGES